jgi:hypothetical protein
MTTIFFGQGLPDKILINNNLPNMNQNRVPSDPRFKQEFWALESCS